MDKAKASAWEADFVGKEIGGCIVESLIDFGKSAAVFRAARDGNIVALKIFDDEIIERYGDKTQLVRISRELTLVGKSHPGMVEIIDGGVDLESGNHFIVMEYLPGPSLEKCLQDVPDEKVPMLIAQLSMCCEHLDGLSLVHRDIKPANIVILDNFTRLVLLDFGVMKPVGDVGLTDAGGIQSFIGTLQYSSPEFLLRAEQDSPEGWRALTLYQIGAVLHDLIMRRPLFSEYANPYARLVMAVQQDIPSVASATIPRYLIQACKAALVKDPDTRLKLVSWRSFRPPLKGSVAGDVRERVTQRSLLDRANIVPEAVPVSGEPDLVDAVVNLLKIEVRRVRNENTAAFPPLTVTRIPPDGNDVCISFRPSAQQGLSNGLTLSVSVDVLDEVAQAIAVSVCAWIGGGPVKPYSASMVTIYKEVFVPATFATALENAMYFAVDNAQEFPCAGSSVSLHLKELEVSF